MNTLTWVDRFLSYVEIKTKIASFLPFLLGIVYVLHAGRTVQLGLTALFFVSMTFFDMATTALNNYIDTRASGTEPPLPRRSALVILILLLAFASISGLILAALTHPVVFLAGAACFFVGITYTFGPAPISRMPLGEFFSGVFMGFFIPFLVVAINTPPDALIQLSWQSPRLSFFFHIDNLLRLLLLCVPPIMGIANIMLANNICDVEHDVQIKRFTLPYYLGRHKALLLFTALYGLSFVATVTIALLGVLPVYTLFALLAYIPVVLHIRTFWKKQDKAETFPLSVQNFILIVLPLVVITGIDLLITR